MSKSHIEAFGRGQLNALIAKDNKDRLKYTMAGCKNGHLYAHDGSDFGLFDVDAPDAEWITPKDLELKRITGVKLESIVKKATQFFADNGDGQTSTDLEVSTDEPKVPVEEIVEDVKEPVEEIDFEVVAKACKKAIKKEDVKKATKLLAKLEGQPSHAKLAKKLGKLA